MTKRDPFDDPDQLRLPPDWLPTYAEPFKPTPEKIKKRRQLFVQMPMWWWEKLAQKPRPGDTVWIVAIHLWHLDWKNNRQPITLGNGMLAHDGINREAKRAALAALERRGLIRVDRRDKKSPIVHLIRNCQV